MSNDLKRISDHLSYYRNKKIGKGTYGVVFCGLFKDKEEAAVKRIQISGVNIDCKEVEILMKLRHPNILRYLWNEKDEDFWYIATELCCTTLRGFVEDVNKFENMIEDLKGMLFEMALGLDYLHSQEVVHRDVKPGNILVSFPASASNTNPQIKLADFGLCRILKMDKEDFSNSSLSNPTGTSGWIAPELYDSDRYDYKVDIFPLGCVFAYTLTGGKHPFGEDLIERPLRVKRKEPLLITKKDMREPYSNNDLAFELITSMVMVDPAYRPTAAEILTNEFFKSLVVADENSSDLI